MGAIKEDLDQKVKLRLDQEEKEKEQHEAQAYEIAKNTANIIWQNIEETFKIEEVDEEGKIFITLNHNLKGKYLIAWRKQKGQSKYPVFSYHFKDEICWEEIQSDVFDLLLQEAKRNHIVAKKCLLARTYKFIYTYQASTATSVFLSHFHRFQEE